MKEQNHKWIKQQKLITCPFDIPEIIEDKDLLQMLIVKGNKLMRYNVNYRNFFIFIFNIYLYIYLFIYF